MVVGTNQIATAIDPRFVGGTRGWTSRNTTTANFTSVGALQDATTSILTSGIKSAVSVQDNQIPNGYLLPTGDVIFEPSGGYTYVTHKMEIGRGTIPTPAETLDVSGIAQATSYVPPSDYRIKYDVEPVYQTVDELRPVSYYHRHLQKQHMGFIAHEMQDVYPELVQGEKDDDIYQSINYNAIIGILVKETQELKQSVKELQNKK